MKSKPTISLCMIVKNEEQHMEQCLKSIESIVDEMIIVDTGSTDHTIDICKKYKKTKMYHFQWNDHFAEARNFGLSFATSEWIIWMDADETIEFNKRELQMEKLKDCKADVIQLPIINYIDGPRENPLENAFTYYQPRLFRNRLGIKFKNRLHEMPYHPQLKLEYDISPLSFQIHHKGYLPEMEQQKSKLKRNLRLLNMEKDNQDPWITYHMANIHYRQMDYPSAFKLVNQSIVEFLLSKLKPPSILYRLKYAILIEANSMDGAWPSIEKAIELYPDYVDLHYCKGCILYQKEEYTEALEAFETCLQLGENHTDYLIYNGVGSNLAKDYKDKCLKKLRKR